MNDSPADWIAGLRVLDLNALASIFPEATVAKDSAATLDTPRTLRRRGKRSTLNALKTANAKQTIGTLPERGESLHVIQSGLYDSWNHVPAMLDLLRPARFLELWIATLGWNETGMRDLLAMRDAGDVQLVTVLSSVYFVSAENRLWTWLVSEFASRPGCRIAAARNHAKVIGIETTDGRYFVIEGSANLRSCRNAEQFCITHDRELFEFHRDWINELCQKANA